MKEIPFVAELAVVKSYEDKEGEFHVVGYAATKDFDLEGDVISLEAMEASKGDLVQNSTMLFNHDPNMPIGKVTTQDIDQKGTLIDAIVDKTAEIPEIKMKVIDAIKQGILNKFSIRAKVLEAVREFVADVGRTANVIKRMLLLEVSLVSVPANPEAAAMEWYVSKALGTIKEGTPDMKIKTLKKADDPVVKALTHNSTLAETEPGWGDVDKTRLPANAFVENAPDVDPELKSSWTFPHHWVEGGGELSDEGVYTTGDMFLSRSGLIAAWGASQGARAGETAAPEIIAHLQVHRKAIGLEDVEADADDPAKKKDAPDPAPAPAPAPAKDPEPDPDVKKDLKADPEPAPAPDPKADPDPDVKKAAKLKGGFPSPNVLKEMWTEFCSSKKVNKTTDPVKIKDAWDKFCKDNEMPEGYAYPYPAVDKTTVDRIAEIASDLLRNADEIVQTLGADLNQLIAGMLEEEVPEPDMSASDDPDPEPDPAKKKDAPDPDPAADPDPDPAADPDPDPDVKKDLKADPEPTPEPPVVKRKGMVDVLQAVEKKGELEKQLDAEPDPQKRLMILMKKEQEVLGR